MYAVTYVVPSDDQMIQTSDDIVVATGVTSLVERDARGVIVTRYTLRIEEVLKGERSVGQHLVLTEAGGILGDQAKYIPGTPEYVPGERYLVFTESNRDAEPVTFGMSLGQFLFVEESGHSLALRAGIDGFDQNWESFTERSRDAGKFVEYIRGVLAHRVPDAGYFVKDAEGRFRATSEWKVASQFTRGSYLMSQGGIFFRWGGAAGPVATFVRNGTQTGVDGPASVTKAFQQWNATASDIDYKDGGIDSTANDGLDDTDGKHGVLFGDPNGEISNASGVAGIGGINSATGPYPLEGEQFYRMIEVDLVINDQAFTQSCLNSVMTHEVGHTLGFRHSNQNGTNGACAPPLECTTNALMNSTVQCNWDGVLKQYDKDAAATVYGSGPVCTPPTIATQPLNRSIALGSTTSIAVVAAGTGPFTYQWYIGASGDTSNPIAGATSATLGALSPTITTQYWVRVTGQCTPAADSNASTVTVQACSPPTITAQPQPKSVTLGASVRMSVNATGTAPLSYQWYTGNSGDTSSPIAGATSSSPNLAPSATTMVWVRVTGQCSPAADSVAVTITVSACPDVVVGQPSATGSVSNWTLSVNATSLATGALEYEWFRGSNPGVGGTKVGEGKTLQVTVTTLTNFWAKVTNSCGTWRASELVTVAPCGLPAITAQPADRTIAAGATTQLAVALTGDNVTVQWYLGTAPDKSAPVATGATITVGPLTTTTSYWATLTNSCGEIVTRTVVVNVEGVVCSAPAITTQPVATQEIKGGESATLTVVATGTAALHYQWYRGEVNVTDAPVGSDLPSLLTGPLFETTKYWVKVTNGCGEAISTSAEVVLPKGRRRGVRSN